jgi:hypothetical protein
VCGRRLLEVPPDRPGQPQPRRLDRAATRLRALRPAAGAVVAAVLVVAAVAGAFAAGWLTRTTPAAPEASSGAAPRFVDEGPETGRRDFNWEARANGITVALRTVTVGTGFSRLELHVEGVRRDREISALQRLRIRDAAGKDLLPGGEVASVATAASRPASGGVDTEVVLDRALDQQAVASVELGGLTLARYVEEQLRGSLVDRELRSRLGDSQDDSDWLNERRDCPACRLQVACQECGTVRVSGSDYRRGRIMILLEARGRVEQTALNPANRRVTVTDDAGISELPAWIDGTGGTAVLSVDVDQLGATQLGDGGGDDPMPFEVAVQGQAEEAVEGGWTIRRPGGSG